MIIKETKRFRLFIDNIARSLKKKQKIIVYTTVVFVSGILFHRTGFIGELIIPNIIDIQKYCVNSIKGAFVNEEILTLDIKHKDFQYLSFKRKQALNLGKLISSDELGASLMQIILILISYQKMFNFTHNDLHTNNIMYIETNIQYLYYFYNDKYYKVPTYGKIFKIIDFGRAIYSFKNELMCSDSFCLTDGDASTQYNFGPYYDKSKPIITPNYSFDLCRLACSIFDFIIDDISEVDTIEDEVHKIIIDWCKDDKNRNILYKNNGEERYLEFKLYKMIARTVHNHLPQEQLNRSYFNKFRVSKKKLKPLNFKKLINIQEFPSYV